MNETTRHLLERYTISLRDYLVSGQEAELHAAYELGRSAVSGGFGVLDMVKIHQLASGAAAPPVFAPGEGRRRALAVETFFMEALSPFEAHHRGFREANARLRELSGKILHAQEEERKRISRELHDEVGQALTAIGLNLQLLKQKAAGAGKKLDAPLTEIQSLLELTMENVHRFSFELRPVMLDDLGLVIALRWYIRAFAKRTGIKIRLSANPCVEQLENEPKIVIYRIVQESLTNVFKYAEAARVNISIRKTAGCISLVVRDDGRGFDPNRAEPRPGSTNGLGLIGMQERLRLVNGQFTVKSAPGMGTTIRVEIPFSPNRDSECERVHEANIRPPGGRPHRGPPGPARVA